LKLLWWCVADSLYILHHSQPHADAHTYAHAHPHTHAPKQARVYLRTGCTQAPHVFEPFYNAALLAWRRGDLQEAWERLGGALAAFPAHTESLDLKKRIRAQLMAL